MSAMHTVRRGDGEIFRSRAGGRVTRLFPVMAGRSKAEEACACERFRRETAESQMRQPAGNSARRRISKETAIVGRG